MAKSIKARLDDLQAQERLMKRMKTQIEAFESGLSDLLREHFESKRDMEHALELLGRNSLGFYIRQALNDGSNWE